MLVLALFVSGAIVGGLIGLYIALPHPTVECGDECGVRALIFALRCALAGAFVLALAGGIIAKARRSSRQG